MPNDIMDEKIDTFLDELYRWNKKTNLTAVARDKAEEILVKPSLSMIGLLDEKEGLHIFDIGSGGGIPAAILAICLPECNVYMIESRERKCSFLKHIELKLELENVIVMNERTDDLISKPEFLESADIITSRQVAPKIVFKAAKHLLKSDGKIIIHRSPKEEYAFPGFEKTDERGAAIAFERNSEL